MARYAISDIHGNCATFKRALDQLQLSPSDELYILGDYVDRGPDTRGVINTIIDLQQKGYRVNCIKGNHEVYMHNALVAKKDDENHLRHWWRAGGEETIASYLLEPDGQDLHQDLSDHLTWIASLAWYIDLGDFLLVHGGLNFKAADPLADKESLVQIRRWYNDINHEWLGDRWILHGHTPTPKWTIEGQLYPNIHPYPAYNIDAGCFHWKTGLGHLCILNMDQRTFDFIPNLDTDLASLKVKKLLSVKQ